MSAVIAACAPGGPPVFDPLPRRTPLAAVAGRPAGDDLPADRSLAWVGAAYYQHYCTDCHGVSGGGDGPGAALLDPPPTDFTDAAYMRDQTPIWYYRSISDGVVGSSMAPWTPRMRREERWDVAFYVWSMAVPAQRRARGADLYAGACAGCHAADGSGVRTARLDDPRRVALSRAAAAAELARAHPDRVPSSPGDRDALAEHLATFLYAPLAPTAGSTPAP